MLIWLNLESLTNGYRDEILDIISIISILSAILVIISKNPVISILCLICLFLSISCYLLVLGINFIALSYLLVYVGAVSILFLFILMLINIRASELHNDTNNSTPLAIIISFAFSLPLYGVLPYIKQYFSEIFIFVKAIAYNKIYYTHEFSYSNINNVKQDTLFVTAKLWDGNLADSNHITTIGNILYTSHSVLLILTSIILLLAMVGAILITIK